MKAFLVVNILMLISFLVCPCTAQDSDMSVEVIDRSDTLVSWDVDEVERTLKKSNIRPGGKWSFIILSSMELDYTPPQEFINELTTESPITPYHPGSDKMNLLLSENSDPGLKAEICYEIQAFRGKEKDRFFLQKYGLENEPDTSIVTICYLLENRFRVFYGTQEPVGKDFAGKIFLDKKPISTRGSEEVKNAALEIADKIIARDPKRAKPDSSWYSYDLTSEEWIKGLTMLLLGGGIGLFLIIKFFMFFGGREGRSSDMGGTSGW